MDEKGTLISEPYLRDAVSDVGVVACVTKKPNLIRNHEVCKECDGIMIISRISDNGIRITRSCYHCKDTEGESTGVEPDTAGPWRLKDVY